MPNDTLETFLGKLDKKQKRGDEWQARCPAHDDHDPSLSVREGDTRPVVVNCFAGCSYDDIAKSVGMDPDSFSGTSGEDEYDGGADTEIPDSLGTERKNVELAVPMEQVEAWADNLWASAAVAESARQYLTKTRALDEQVLKGATVGLAHAERHSADHWLIFPAIHEHRGECVCVALKFFGFDPQHQGWAQSKGRKVARNVDSGLILYCPGTKPFAQTPVIVCEGEVDALSALSAGYNAASPTTGANSFKPLWAQQIRSRPAARMQGVVVCYDGDTPGEEGTEKAAEILRAEGLPVRVARPPEGMDVNDVWRSGEHSLDSLIDTATRYERWI